MAPSHGLLDLTVYGRQESWEDSPAGWLEGRPVDGSQWRANGRPHRPMVPPRSRTLRPPRHPPDPLLNTSAGPDASEAKPLPQATHKRNDDRTRQNLTSVSAGGLTTGFAGLDWGAPRRARNPKVLGGCK